MTQSIGNNLLVLTSSQMSFSDAAPEGAISRESLVNRVKKLSQAERKNLLDELSVLSVKVGISGVATGRRVGTIKDEDLKKIEANFYEKGNCTLLLADDGKYIESPSFFVSFWRFLCNKLGTRISSASIVKELKAFQAECGPINSAAVAGSFTNEVVMEQLQREIDVLNREIKALVNGKNLQKAINQLQKLLPLLDNLSADLKFGNYVTVLTKIRQLNEFVNENNLCLPTEKRRDLIQALTCIPLVFTAGTGKLPLEQFAESILFHRFGLQGQSADLNSLIVKKPIAEKKMSSQYWMKNAVIPIAKKLINGAIDELTIEMSAEESQKTAFQSRVDTLQSRLDNFVRLNQAKKEIQDEASSLQQAKIKLESINEIIDVIEPLIIQARNSSFKDLKDFAEIADSLVPLANEIRTVRLSDEFSCTFGDCLSCIVDVLTMGDSSIGEKLAKTIDSGVQAGSALITKLKNLQEGNEEERKNLANDYVQYLKVVFEGKQELARAGLESAERAFQQRTKAINELKKEKKPLLIKPAPIASEEKGALETPKPIEKAKIPSAITIPGLAPEKSLLSRDLRDALIPLAKEIQNTRGGVGEASKTAYSKVSNHELASIVYGQFYWIMEGAGHVFGLNDSWGECVFLAKESSNRKDNWQDLLGSHLLSDQELNDYRIQAMVEVINGEIRKA